MELTTAARRRHRKTTPGQDALVWPRGSGSLGVGKARSKKDAGASTNEKAVVTEHNRALMSNCPSSTKVQGPGNANFPSTCKKCGV
ncbi:hypothetical protein SEVIR_3G366550v4 [Setaria viridis]